jgi:phosphate transport system permease protein
MQPVLELFTGIPSIIYGFLGLVLLVPLVAQIYNSIAGGFFYAGYGIIAAALVLAVMIFPTITTITVDALSALPNGLREASLALGATRWQTIRRTLLPAATSGILTGVILGIGRAIGETLAVSYVIGSNANRFPIAIDSVYPYFHLLPTSTITVQLLLDFLEVTPGTLNFDALWTLAFILLAISFLLVLASRWVASHSAYSMSDASAKVSRGKFWQRRATSVTETRSVA